MGKEPTKEERELYKFIAYHMMVNGLTTVPLSIVQTSEEVERKLKPKITIKRPKI